MSKPEDIPQRVQNIGAKMAGEYLSWLNAGNSTGSLSEHAVAAMADTIARAILAAEQRERERIIAQCEAVKASFLSPEYAANQPLGSLCERFAIDQCIEAIRGSSHD